MTKRCFIISSTARNPAFRFDRAAFSQPMRYIPSLSYAHRAGSPRPYGMSKLRLIISCFDRAARTHPAPYKPCLRHAHRAGRPRPYGMSKLRLIIFSFDNAALSHPAGRDYATPPATNCCRHCRSFALMRLSTFYLVCTRVYEQDTCVLIVTLQLHKYVVVRRAEGD